jgi:transposase-like protein
MAKVDRNNPKRVTGSESQYSLMEFMQSFPDDRSCLDYLWREKYSADGSHAYCPKCDKERKFHRVKDRPAYDCDTCGYHLHPTAGTIFHKSPTSLHLWFYAMYIMASTRCGVSAKQLERELGVTYKTAWRMFTLIRNEAMARDDGPLSGDVEMDETYIGGKPRQGEIARQRRKGLNPHQAGQAAGRAKKTTVFGMVERGGKVAAHVVPTNFQDDALRHIETRVMPAASIYTDEASAYTPLKKKGYNHRRIHHAQKVYVDGDVHTQTIEGFWSLVKRGIGGTHHAVSAKYLQGYLNEYVWRYNRRDSGRAMFLDLIEAAASDVR